MPQLPLQFLSMIAGLATEEPRVASLPEALTSTEPSVAVRLNPRKPRPDIAATPGAEGVAWCAEGLYLPERPQFTLDPAMHQGRYYVQDASSMFISRVIKQITVGATSPLAYLDACAAPGGKTTAAIDALPEGSMVVANEYDFRRAEILKENVVKWGYPSVVVSRGDTSRLGRLRGAFDIVAADVPCSGEGMMRKDEEAVDQWSERLVAECAARQREIVDNLWGALKPGGYFIYSTCTFNRTENEDIAAYIMENYGAGSVRIDLPDSCTGILPAIGAPGLHVYRFMPHLSRGEGLFMTVLRKPGHTAAAAPSRSCKPSRLQVKLPAWFPEGYLPELAGDGTLVAVDPRWAQLVADARRHLDVILAGLEVAEIKGRDLIPAHAAAMLAGAETMKEIPTAELTRDAALDYLRREAITLPGDAPRGYVVVTWQGVPLGWVKNLGNRSNNLYPSAWRIRRL